MTKLKSITKRTLSVLLCMVMVLSVFMSVPFTASADVAYSFEENGIRYLELDDSTVSVVGANPETMPEDVVIPETVQGKTVTTVGERAFYRSNIKSVILPKNLQTIDQSAFSLCDIRQLTIPSSVSLISYYAFNCNKNLTDLIFEERTTPLALRKAAFSSCESLTSITLPDSVNITSGIDAFSGCTSLRTVKLPDNADAIPAGFFSDCTNLESVQGGKITSIGSNAFKNCTSIANYDFTYCTNIGEYAFFGCTNLQSVQANKIKTIGNSAFLDCCNITSFDFTNCTSIGNSAFQGCTSFTSVIIPNNVVRLGNSVFGLCTGLTSATLPNNNITLGTGVFNSCTNLKTVKLPDSMEAIPNYLFYDCINLENIETGKITRVGSNAFQNCRNITGFDFTYCNGIGSSAFSGCTGLTSITLPDNVVTLGNGAFSRCTNLKTAKLPDNISTIADSCFSNCTSLESIQTGVIKEVGYCAFYNCENLSDISFVKDNSISKVGESAFNNCTKLTEIDLHNAQYIYDSAFENCTSLTNVCLEGNTKLKSIGQRAFFGCASLEVIDIPATCKTIDDEAFMNCESLYYVNIKSGLKKVEEKAFFNCYSLYEMVIPKSVEYIGEMAFGCYEKDGKYYSYGDFIVAGVKSSLADEYAEAYNVYWALNAPKLTKIENTSSGVKITFSKPSGASSGKYEVYRCTDNTEWKLLGTTTSLSYTDKTAKAGTKYYYTVQFIGKPTNSINDYPLEMVRLSTPKVSKITNTNSGAQLTWGKITGAKKYIVYVKSSSGWKKLGESTSTSFTHTAAKSGTSYTYTVRACDSSGNYKSAYVSAGYTNKYIAPPTLKAVSNTTSGVKITWNKSTGATEYRVFVKSGSSWKKLGDTSSTSFTHKSAKSGTKYTYTVRCLSSTGKSYVSGYDKTGISGVYLSAPKVSKISNAQNGAKLTWGKVAGATKYNIYVKSGSKWKKIDETTKTSYTHTAAKSGKSYTYTVRAYDSSGAKSAYVSAGYKNKFIATPVITSLSSTKKGVKISWGAVEGAVNYRVLVKTSSGWKKVGDTTSTSLVDKSTKNGKSYTYIVRCLSSSGKSYVSGYDKVGTTVTYKK